MQGEITVFVDGNQLAGVLDVQELSGVRETDLLVSTEVAAAQGKPPVRVKAPVSSASNVPANIIINLPASESGSVALNVPRAGKYLGLRFAVSAGEEIRVSSANINEDEILSRQAQGAPTAGNLTLTGGALLEGGNAEPQYYFLFFDKTKKGLVELAPTDKLNLGLTNTKTTAASMPVQIMTTLPKAAIFLN